MVIGLGDFLNGFSQDAVCVAFVKECSELVHFLLLFIFNDPHVLSLLKGYFFALWWLYLCTVKERAGRIPASVHFHSTGILTATEAVVKGAGGLVPPAGFSRTLYTARAKSFVIGIRSPFPPEGGDGL